MSRTFLKLAALGISLGTLAAVELQAHDMSGHVHGAGERSSRAASTCREPIPSCAISATPVFEKDGALRLVYSVAGRVYVARSTDDGRSFETAVAVTETPADVDDNFDGRPMIAVAPNGTIALTWSVWRDKNWNGQVLTSRSTDGGKTFSMPKPITESVSQRFATIAFAPDNTLWATWLDKRNLAAAKASGDDYAGAGLAVGVSKDGGGTFAPATIVSDRTCECCRVSLAFDPDGAAVAGWRQIFGKNFRDHEIGRISPDGTKIAGVRVSEDNWAIDACPHHGPSLSINSESVRHIVWYTGGTVRNGLFYAHAPGPDGAFSAPAAFGDVQRAPSHPYVLAAGQTVARAWKEFDGERTAIMVQTSANGGDTWTPSVTTASTIDASDHPILLARGGRMYLSWLTKTEGYRLLPISTGPDR